MVRLFSVLIALLFVAAPGYADAARCKNKGGRPQVFIRGKTPLRRGPGLNYGVASFLEKGRCAPYSEVSIDQQWVLIEVGGAFGWVPFGRLNKASRKRLAKAGSTGPVGSGQARGTARVFRQSVLLERPDPGAPVRRVLPENLRVLPLALTREGLWVQIRDERGDIGWVATQDLVGDTLARLPRTETRGGADVRAPASGVQSGRRMALSRGSSSESFGGEEAGAVVAESSVLVNDDSRWRFALFGAALNPIHSLDSNGVNGLRRYDLAAFSPGTAVEIEARNLGPIDLRLGYTIAFLSGVEADNIPDTGQASGMQHEAYFRAGLPLAFSGVVITPELGYHFGMFDFDTILDGQLQQVVFLSTQSHLGTLGARLQAVLLDGVILDFDVGGLLGVTAETPRDLGEAGLTLGFFGQVGARIALGDALSLLVRYAANYRTTGYTGVAELDPTITEATLTDIAHGLLAGVAFDL